ncbi:MAG TPA: hypothetical protein DEF00_00190 [Candidatus Taylorbacteria bacterium]|nr:MAG: hypothetical protein UY29_C0017G0010 [Parcubacteria group bacterium GW2011_GWC2_48_17]HBV00800.1 hypothetical protein [Candidatus Taylorbacteria bacterium]
MWAGAWLLILPFSGVPGNWKEALTILTALFLIVYSYALRRGIRSAEDLGTAPVAEGKIQNHDIKSAATAARQDSDT